MEKIRTIAVYLGSGGFARPVFRESAERLGTLIGEQRRRLVYGGMDAGLMGLIANRALAAGAHVTGIIPKRLKDSERIHPALSETILVGDLWERKRRMFMASDAVAALPGGFGTLDESLEILYWGALGLHSKPLALVNIEGYWTPIVEYLKKLPDFNKRYLIVANSVEEVIPALEKWNFGHAIIKEKNNLPHFEDEILAPAKTPITLSEATLKDTCRFITALGLKQLGRHGKPMGILNEDGSFDRLVQWLESARREHFITENCMKLFDVAGSEAELAEKLLHQHNVEIDLNRDKWGPGETGTHLSVHEEE